MVVVKCRVETIETLNTSASLHYQLYYQETVNMSKRHSLVDTSLAQEPKQPKMPCTTNWTICALCQEGSSDDPDIQCPIRSTKKPVGAGFVSLAKDLLLCKEAEYFPLPLDLTRLDEGKGIESALVVNEAVWHKRCRVMFNQSMLNRYLKQQSEKQKTSGINTRSSIDSMQQVEESLCFFCDDPAGPEGFHEVMTKQLDINVRQCATQLKDTKL